LFMNAALVLQQTPISTSSLYLISIAITKGIVHLCRAG
jgi:hypothetical protein